MKTIFPDILESKIFESNFVFLKDFLSQLGYIFHTSINTIYFLQFLSIFISPSLYCFLQHVLKSKFISQFGFPCFLNFIFVASAFICVVKGEFQGVVFTVVLLTHTVLASRSSFFVVLLVAPEMKKIFTVCRT